EIDTTAQEVRLAGRPIPLTPTERGLLMTLARRPGQAFTRRQLMEAVWGDTWIGDDHLVDVHIANLRRKLDETAESARYVTTVRGIGYRMGKGCGRDRPQFIEPSGALPHRPGLTSDGRPAHRAARRRPQHHSADRDDRARCVPLPPAPDRSPRGQRRALPHRTCLS